MKLSYDVPAIIDTLERTIRQVKARFDNVKRSKPPLDEGLRRHYDERLERTARDYKAIQTTLKKAKKAYMSR